tara:strand:+ start:227 stop:439 length:213 start_codon:yes stop_codon:yes gene_type:complete
MSKQNSYQKLIKDFNHSGGRNPNGTEIEAWETGYDSGVRDAYRMLKKGIKMSKPDLTFNDNPMRRGNPVQ